MGTRFESCHVQFPVCGASRCSLATGWPTSVRGHRSLYYFLKPNEPNLFRYLRQAGYDVFLFGKNDALAPETLADSVTEWRNPRNPAAEFAAIDKPQFPNTMLLPPGGDRRGTVDYAVIQLAIQVLERSEERRVGKECGSRWSPYHEKKKEERMQCAACRRRHVAGVRREAGGQDSDR